MNKKKHMAEQTVMPLVEPPVKLSLTLYLKGDLARQWRRYAARFAEVKASNAQLAEALLAKALSNTEGL